MSSSSTASVIPIGKPPAATPTLGKRQRESWSSLVDLVASDTTEDTSAISNLRDFDALPNMLPHAVPAELRQGLQAYGAAFEDARGAAFQPQITLAEGYHAKPIPIRSSDLFSKNIGSGMRASTAADGGAVAGGAASIESDHVQLMERKAASIAPMVLRMANQLPIGPSSSGGPSSSNTDRTPIEKLQKEDLLFGSTDRLTQGFRRQRLLDRRYARPNFLPIILIPSGPTAAIQLFNVRAFLEEGLYMHPSESYMNSSAAGETSREDSKPENVVVTPKAFFSAETLRNSAFTKFRVVDDPRKIENWDHVCACIVTGVDWQLQEWFGGVHHPMKQLGKPSELFHYLRGFLAYFEEDKVPAALTQWNVHPIVLTRKYVKSKAHILQAYTFWEELYRFISTNHRFSRYVASGIDE